MPRGDASRLPPGKGRPLGSKNKFTTLKNAFLNVYQELGGEQWLREHANDKAGKRDFFMALVKMLPTKTDVDLNGHLAHTIEIVDYSKAVDKKDASSRASKQD